MQCSDAAAPSLCTSITIVVYMCDFSNDCALNESVPCVISSLCSKGQAVKNATHLLTAVHAETPT